MAGRGRGWFYKQKYGGVRGGRGRGGRGRGDRDSDAQSEMEDGQRAHESDPADDADNAADDHRATGHAGLSGTAMDLEHVLQRIDGKGYKAYHDCKGRWTMNGAFILCVDHIQADPFAAPSRFRLEVPADVAQLPSMLWETKIRRIALCDYLTRSFAKAIKSAGADIRRQTGHWQGEKGGEMSVDRGRQHVLERTSVLIHDQGMVEARFTVALPARGRTVLGRWAADVLVRNLPRYVQQGLHYSQQDQEALHAHICCVEDTQALRDALPKLGLVGFVGNGSILPRASGDSDKPLPGDQAIPFKSPPALEVEIDLPNRGGVCGMGIGPGVTLIVGGGFHGKSTLLKALEAGISNKVPEDGRELVVVNPGAYKIRAEDGRRVEGVDISAFISNLPYERPTQCFRTDDASGSTSQAANIMEALEVGSELLLIDEDTTATNFMIRDARMQALVAPDKEPITPLVAKIRALANSGVSCVLVVGGSGDYFEVAERVICMEAFAARDVSQQAHAIARQFGFNYSGTDSTDKFGPLLPRVPASVYPNKPADGRDVKVTTRDLHNISFGSQSLDLSAVEQLFEKSQTRAIADALLILMEWVKQPHCRGKTMAAILDALDADIDSKGLDALSPWKKSGDLARPRKQEIAAALNRLRSLKVEQA